MEAIDTALRNTDEMIATIALTIYVVSLVATIIEILQRRTQEHRSNMPVCVVYSTGVGGRIAVVVQNIGDGSFVTTSLRFYDKGSPGTPYLADLVPRMTSGFCLIDHAKGSNFEVASGEEMVVIELKEDQDRESTNQTAELLRNRLREITMELEFQDVSKNILPKVTYKLENFGKKIPFRNEVALSSAAGFA